MIASQARSLLRPRPIAACLASALALGMPSIAAPTQASDTAALDLVQRYRIEYERLAGRTSGIEQRVQPTAPNAVLRVENCDDHGPGSLREAIVSVDVADVIDLTHLACSRITLTTGALTTDQDRIVLLGPGADKLTIDGSGSDRVFMHTGTWELKLVNLSVTNGATDGKGGCLYSSSRVRLYDTSVTSCAAGDRGGAAYAKTQFFMYRSTIADSTTQAIGDAGGGAYVKGGFSGVVLSAMSGNSAPNGQGGALSTRDDTFVSRSTLSGNSAMDGGAVAVPATAPTIIVTGSTLSANHATHDGGGVHVLTDLRLIDDTIAFNSADGSGGGVYIADGIVMLNTIAANNTQGGAAGDIAGGGIASISGEGNLVMASSVTLPGDTLNGDPMLGPLADHGGFGMTHALVSGSIAIDSGNNSGFLRYDQRYRASARIIGAAPDIGAYEVQTIGTTTAVVSCADSGAGTLRDAIANAKSGDTIDMTALGCGTITLSGVLEIPVGSLTLIGPGAGELTLDGGGVGRVIDHSGYGTLRISGVTFTGGSTVNDYNVGGGCLHSTSTLDLSDVVVEQCSVYNQFTAAGGGIAAGRLVLTRSTVTNNLSMASLTAKGGGVAVYGDFTMRDSTVSNNRAVTTYDHYQPKAFSRAGGILAMQSGTVDISGSTISGNVAGNASLELPGYVGGLLIGYASFMTPARITNTTISGNTAASATGGVYVTSALTLRNSTIAFNTAITGDTDHQDTTGSGLHVTSPWIDISGTIIAGNTAPAPMMDLSGTSQFFGANNLIATSAIAVPPDTLTDDPMLAPLQDNGGPTWTHALAPLSPAIDHGSNVAMLANDQRGAGYPRVRGAAADIGAFELQEGLVDAIFADGFENP